MSKIKYTYEKMEDVPEQYRDLYTEKDGKAVLTGVEGLKTDKDVHDVREALRKEKEDHKATKSKFKALDGKDIDEVLAQLDEIEELRTKAAGNVDEDKIDELAEKKAQRLKAPLEREVNKLRTENEELKSQNGELTSTITGGKIETAIRRAAEDKKVLGTAVEDVVAIGSRLFEVAEDGKIVTKDGVGVTPGLEASVWLGDMQDKRPHWWPTSQGGGSKGGRDNGGFAENPWSDAGWNLTKQGEQLNKDRGVAEQMARAAGTTIGGPRPKSKAA